MRANGEQRKRTAPRGTGGRSLADFGTADVIRIVGLSAGALRSMVRQRYVLPARAARGARRYSFQDLIALRAARALSHAGLSGGRIMRALRELRRHLPAQLPLSGLSIRASGEQVVVREAGTEWESDSGQYLLALEVCVDRTGVKLSEELPVAVAPLARKRAVSSAREAAGDRQRRRELDAEALFIEALASEERDVSAAMTLYRRCLRADSGHLDAHINLARLLQEAGQPAAAERLYRHANCRVHGVAQFNLAVLLEDQGRVAEAIERYLSVVALDPHFADAHYNLARLYDLQGNAPHTIRHLRALQRLGRPAPH